MTQMKKIARSATVAYSPGGKYMALGTVAAAVDLSFSTSSTLEVATKIEDPVLPKVYFLHECACAFLSGELRKAPLQLHILVNFQYPTVLCFPVSLLSNPTLSSVPKCLVACL